MTLLHYEITPAYVQIYMDTIALTDETKELSHYTTKFYPLPHLNMVICGTGMGKVILEWFAYVNSNMLVRDINHLNEFTSAKLIDLGNEYQLDHYNTATIYHFGYSIDEKRFKCYVYRSTTRFLPEVQYDGFAVKPMINHMEDFINNGVIDTFGLAFQQYNEDRLIPREKRIGIGGELICCRLTDGIIQIRKIMSFFDYGVNYKKMCENLKT